MTNKRLEDIRGKMLNSISSFDPDDKDVIFLIHEIDRLTKENEIVIRAIFKEKEKLRIAREALQQIASKWRESMTPDYDIAKEALEKIK